MPTEQMRKVSAFPCAVAPQRPLIFTSPTALLRGPAETKDLEMKPAAETFVNSGQIPKTEFRESCLDRLLFGLGDELLQVD